MEGAVVIMKIGYWTLEEKMAFRKLSPEEKELEIQKEKEMLENMTDEDLPPAPSIYIDL